MIQEAPSCHRHIGTHHTMAALHPCMAGVRPAERDSFLRRIHIHKEGQGQAVAPFIPLCGGFSRHRSYLVSDCVRGSGSGDPYVVVRASVAYPASLHRNHILPLDGSPQETCEQIPQVGIRGPQRQALFQGT